MLRLPLVRICICCLYIMVAQAAGNTLYRRDQTSNCPCILDYITIDQFPSSRLHTICLLTASSAMLIGTGPNSYRTYACPAVMVSLLSK